MVVKKLRVKNNWSQEQLATMCGLSIRTIQRVESGQSASIETLKCLASVFEVDICKLTEEITVIDKKSEKWNSQPFWFKAWFWGIRTRRTQLWIEILLVIGGIGNIILDGYSLAPILLLAAYFSCCVIRYGDNNKVW